MRSHMVISIGAVAVLLVAHPCFSARARPDVSRSIHPIGELDDERMCRLAVQVRNNDTPLISAIVVPCDQGSWKWREPADSRWRKSWIDIRGSARAGVGAWRSEMHQELWSAPSERSWIGECELGGIEKGATIEIVFFVVVADTVDPSKMPFRLAYRTCDEDARRWSPVYWSVAGEMPLERSGNMDTLQVYKYVGCSDTVGLFNMSGVKGATASDGWEVAESGPTHIVFVSSVHSGTAEFTVLCNDSVGSTGLINWREGMPTANSGFELGPGTAQYSLADTAAVYKEPEWLNVLAALAGTAILFLGTMFLLRLYVPRRR